jgi:2-oxoglutarate ferredoxin oxidoreductase subunit beta
MFGLNNEWALSLQQEEYHTLEDYQGRPVRWCPGCGDNGILAAVQRLCRDEQLAPEKSVFVSGIGCAARFPHYMNAYGFHGLHGRALPTAEGIRIHRPDLHVFVNMGDGDCCSIGTAHWIHAIRLNMKMVVMMHDNNVYGLTKMQASPTTPIGLRTNTTPHGAPLRALNPLATTLGVTNVSFVAQTVEWVPEVLYDVIRQAYHHNGFAFIRILQRCPHFMPNVFSSFLSDPKNVLLLRHENGIRVSDAVAKLYPTQENHDPSNLDRAREIAELEDKMPVGILYRNESVPRYEEIKRPRRAPSWELTKAVLEAAFDKHGIFPRGVSAATGNGDGSARE